MACDANDEILHSVIRNKLAASYQGGTFDNADSCVVPRDFKFDDEVAVYSLAANGLMACTTELEIKRRDFIDLNLAQVDRDSTLTVRPTFTFDQSAGLMVCQSVLTLLLISIQQYKTISNNKLLIVQTQSPLLVVL